MWRAAVEAALPSACLPGHWPAAPNGHLAVIACGKAAMGMAAVAARHYGDRCGGIVIFPGGADCAATVPPGFRPWPASHPYPDEHSLAAAQAALELAASLGRRDLLLVLLSGGGSALMCLPIAGVALSDKQSLTRQLLASGAAIEEINCVRKHLSGIKGGRLALASVAPVCTLAISDVPGDDPGTIASGPTVGDRSNLAEARETLARWGIEPSPTIRHALADPANETPKPGDLADHSHGCIVASGMTALRAATTWCRERGVETLLLGDQLQGEAQALAREHARQAAGLAAAGRSLCLLSGGETTVKMGPHPGRGGRNTEYALALALALDRQPGVWALAVDTDGIDGVGGHAGAVVDPRTLDRAARAGLDAEECLRRNDSAGFFERAGGLLADGPTGTNVNDFRAILVNP
jgi:hydroxypyruvate reductase